MMIKMMNRFMKKPEVPVAPPVPSKEELLLAEIRDLLKQNAK
jgi:large conductance mechanosensitive channel